MIKAFDRTAAPLARLLPAVLWLASLLFIVKAPYEDLNFFTLRPGREHAVALIESGLLRPNDRGVVDVSQAGPLLSAGGNEAMIDTCGGKTCVLFFYYRGLMHHYSGFLYVPTGGDPYDFDDVIQERGFVRARGGNWYYIGQ